MAIRELTPSVVPLLSLAPLRESTFPDFRVPDKTRRVEEEVGEGDIRRTTVISGHILRRLRVRIIGRRIRGRLLRATLFRSWRGLLGLLMGHR